MLDEKEEKRQKRNVKFSVMLMICAVIIAYEYNLHGYALALSFVIGLSIMWTPVVLFWIAYYVRAKRILRKNLDEAEYMIYKLMKKDPNHVYLINYPDQKKLKEAKADIKKIFVIMGILMALKTFNTFIIIGVLRSGGDTKYALFLEMGCMWIVSLPLTFFAAYKGLPIYILVGLTYTEEVVKFIFGVPRAISKKWAQNLVKNI